MHSETQPLCSDCQASELELESELESGRELGRELGLELGLELGRELGLELGLSLFLRRTQMRMVGILDSPVML